MTHFILALGSNLGDRLANLVMATRLLEERGVTISARSSAWETAPVPADQPPFLNAVIAGETSLTAADLLRVAKEVERLLGRVPSRQWGPRPIDVDILFYGDQQIGAPDLTIPHPRIAERDFVLVPLAEVVEGTLPVLDQTARELLSALPSSSASRTGALSLPG